MIKRIALFLSFTLVLVSCNFGGSGNPNNSNGCILNPVYDAKQHVCLNPNPPLPIRGLYIYYVLGASAGDRDIQIPVGSSLQFYALAMYQDGLYYDVTNKVDWITNSYSSIPNIYHWSNANNYGELNADAWGDVHVQGAITGVFSPFVNVNIR